MRSQLYLVSRNVMIGKVRTSMRLEPDVWEGLAEICRRERMSINEVCTIMKGGTRDLQSLTSSVRMHVLGYFRRAATPQGHRLAGHGTGEAAIIDAPLPGSAHEHGVIGSHHAVVNGLQHGRNAVGHAELTQDVLGVKFDAAVRDRK